MRPSAYPLVEVDAAAALVLDHIPVLGVERVALAHCIGRVLAEDLVAPASLPLFPSSAVDGYAVRSADAGKPLRVLGESAAGRPFSGTIAPGTAARILTGGVLPDGADCVVMVEEVRLEGDVVTTPSPLHPGTNFHAPGADVRAGEKVALAGTQLGAAELGLAAALNFPRLPVHRRPRVALLSTGDELVEVGGKPGRGQIVDSNRWALLAALREAGAEVRGLGIGPDEPEALRKLVVDALREVDVLVTSGGVSVGTHDLIKPLLESLGTVHVGRVKLKPGKPFTFATIPADGLRTSAVASNAPLPGPLPRGGEGEKPPGRLSEGGDPPWGGGPGGPSSRRTPPTRGGEGAYKLAFGLPGFPVSSLVTFEVFVRPALRKMQGFASLQRPILPVRLAYDARASADRTEFQRVTLRRDGRDLVADTTGSQSSSRLMSLAGAHALVRIPPGGHGISAGSIVDALILSLP